MERKTLAIVGCGKLAQVVVKALKIGLLEDYKLVGTYSRTYSKAKDIADLFKDSNGELTCIPCESIDELFKLKPNYIIEMASPASLKEIAIPALRSGSSIVTLSVGALADEVFYKEVKETALENGTRLHIASGAIGGFDLLRTVSLMEESEVTFNTKKGPHSLKNTDIYDEVLESEERVVFEGNAKDAIALFPTKVNVSVAASLASIGPKEIKVSITSIPRFIGDDHKIEIMNSDVHAVIDVYSKTSQIAGWSVVNTLRNITSPIVF